MLLKLSAEDVQQEAGPEVIWRLDDAAWLHSFRVWTFALPILRLFLSLPTLVPQGYSVLLVSILSGESKELITTMKARGYSGERASGTRYDLH